MSKSKGIAVVLLIAVVAIGIVAWHDGLIGTTSIRDINQGDIAVGTAVTIKGELTVVLFDLCTVATDNGLIVFTWDGSKPPLNSIVVVRGTVSSIGSLSDVTSVDSVWIIP
jgi:hypothetical protein